MIGAIQTGSATGHRLPVLDSVTNHSPEQLRKQRSSTSGTSRSETSESRGANVNSNIIMDRIHVHRTVVTINDADSEAGGTARRRLSHFQRSMVREARSIQFDSESGKVEVWTNKALAASRRIWSLVPRVVELSPALGEADDQSVSRGTR
ncbi:hypothetical protein B0H14DRAFT_2566085 [Mycena olivaceomarginata]|nr:hypothetical protein B0H14DRAFT_2566085 [Mycena olivaceomarginata]